MKPYNSLRIRPKSEPKPSRWEWLNKPIVLWFLSSVVVGGFTISYGAISAHLQAAALRQSTLEKLVVTLRVREDVATLRLDNILKAAEEHKTSFQQEKSAILETLREYLNGSSDNNAYPEYRDSSAIGLSYQIQQLGGSTRSSAIFLPGLIKEIEEATTPEQIKLPIRLVRWSIYKYLLPGEDPPEPEPPKPCPDWPGREE